MIWHDVEQNREEWDALRLGSGNATRRDSLSQSIPVPTHVCMLVVSCRRQPELHREANGPHRRANGLPGVRILDG